jgi:hypothetical protein
MSTMSTAVKSGISLIAFFSKIAWVPQAMAHRTENKTLSIIPRSDRFFFQKEKAPPWLSGANELSQQGCLDLVIFSQISNIALVFYQSKVQDMAPCCEFKFSHDILFCEKYSDSIS